MRTRTLGPLEVSVVGLGCNNFGGRIDARRDAAVVDAALDAGVTLFDTADIYGNARRQRDDARRGRSQGRRDQVVLATKFGSRWATARGRARLAGYVRAALDGVAASGCSTDHVDLYQHHQDDRGRRSTRRSARSTSSSRGQGARRRDVELLAPSRSREAAAIARELGSRVRLRAERVFVARARRRARSCCPLCERLGLGFIPYFPLASGLLTGKVSRERAARRGTRLHGRDDRRREARPRRAARSAWAEAHGVTLLEVAIGGLAAVPPVASVIAGATKPEQVRANAAAGEWEPTPDELAELRAL